MAHLNLLSNDELISRTEQLVKNEREITEQVIAHFVEIDGRRLYATQGYNSMFDFATRGLGYSNSGAMRRIKAARVASRAPRVLQHLETGALNLGTVEVLSWFLDDEGLEGMAEASCGRSREEVEKLAARKRPVTRNAVRDRVEPVFVGNVVAHGQEAFEYLATPIESDENSVYFRSNALRISQELEERYQISFNAGEDFKVLLTRAQELLFTGDRETMQLENVIAAALEFYVSRHCPKRRQQRRDLRKAKKLLKTGVVAASYTTDAAEQHVPVPVSAPNEIIDLSSTSSDPIASATAIPTKPNAKDFPERSRRIPVWLRDEVLKRDGYKCNFVSDRGVPCGCPFNLEIDHIVPFARGGVTSSENLQVLCQVHNLFRAFEEYRDEFMGAKMKA